MALGEIVSKVPTVLVAWAFIVFVVIVGVFSGYAIYAWHKERTIVIAGYEFGQPSIGAGAVVAYDADRCPKGWVSFKPAAARFIIGAGGPLEFGYDTGENGQQLTLRGHRVIGGSETHTLTLPEMPRHAHHVMVGQSGGNGPVVVSWELGEIGKGKHAGLTEYVGGPVGAQPGAASPHNNMPPYMALRFCRKGADEQADPKSAH
ncbi:MAG: hypothetical protein AAF526_06705 [Pseudomonadota bacterium]